MPADTCSPGRSFSSGGRLLLNVSSAAGDFAAEGDRRATAPDPAVHAGELLPVQTDNTLQEVRWRGVADLGSVAGQKLRFRFRLRSASLYSFWVASDENGARMGYVGAGDLGLPRDSRHRKGPRRIVPAARRSPGSASLRI